MRFAVPGPLSESVDAGPLQLGGRKQRALLAMLSFRANQVVVKSDLVDAIRGEHPPLSALESVDSYVYRLRKQLGHDRSARPAEL
jgi:DNA-binding SARP family transcriptional activator